MRQDTFYERLINIIALRNETGVVPRWLSGVDKIRGVNLGSAFIIERWMAEDEWRKMGCGNTQDEWSCVEQLGQSAADAAFKTHWDTWITQDDINKIVSLGLNTIRIPVGFWIFEDIVRDNEHYPRGGLQYLDRVVRQAKDAGLYIIMDLHGGPGSQQTRQQFTGHVSLPSEAPCSHQNCTLTYMQHSCKIQVVDYPEFYNADNFGRAALWLWRMAERIHTNPDYYNVGMLQVMNEPVHAWQYPNEAQKMIREFYPQALNSIRDAENSLGVSGSDRLHVQYMVRPDLSSLLSSLFGSARDHYSNMQAGQCMGLR
jgi:aryl-phospho-beta-D-glucosidase BglC (GH1 family)